MHILFQKEILQKAMNTLQKVAMNKTSSNLPGSIYITTRNHQVEFQANDFELGIKVIVEAEIQEEGTLVVSSRYFQELVRKMPGATIELQREEGTNKLFIKSGSSEINLVTLNVEDFTLIEQVHDENQFLIDAAQLKETIDLTSYAAATDNNRPIFTGALVDVNEKDFTMVATDTHRMAVKKITLDSTAQTPMRAILPMKLLSELSRLLPTENPTVVKIIWNRTQVALLFENVYIVSRLIEGTYPDYEKVIPVQFDASAVLNRHDFAGAVERVSLLAKDTNYNVIRYDWQDGEVTLSSRNSDIGMAKESVNCEFKGDPFTISFNGRFISDILRRSEGEQVHFYLKQNGALVIRQEDNPHYTYVVTPVRV